MLYFDVDDLVRLIVFGLVRYFAPRNEEITREAHMSTLIDQLKTQAEMK